MTNHAVIMRTILTSALVVTSIWLIGTQGILFGKHAVLYGSDTTIPITTNDLTVTSSLGTTTYHYEDMDFEGGKCFCQRLAFRSAQAFLAATGATAINSDTLTITTRWNTHGAEELFIHALGWDDERVIYPANLTDEAYLTVEDAAYYFAYPEGETIWKVQATEHLFPEGFFEKRTAFQTASTPEEKQAAQQAFMPLKTQAISIITTLPLTNAFTVQAVSHTATVYLPLVTR